MQEAQRRLQRLLDLADLAADRREDDEGAAQQPRADAPDEGLRAELHRHERRPPAAGEPDREADEDVEGDAGAAAEAGDLEHREVALAAQPRPGQRDRAADRQQRPAVLRQALRQQPGVGRAAAGFRLPGGEEDELVSPVVRHASPA